MGRKRKGAGCPARRQLQRLDSNVIILKVKKATLTVAFLTEWGGVTHTPAPLLSCRGSRCNCAPKCAPSLNEYYPPRARSLAHASQ